MMTLKLMQKSFVVYTPDAEVTLWLALSPLTTILTTCSCYLEIAKLNTQVLTCSIDPAFFFTSRGPPVASLIQPMPGVRHMVKDSFLSFCLNRATLVIREGLVEQGVKVLGLCVQTRREREETVLLRGEME